LETRPVNRFQRRKERTRRQLKESALALILEKGYDAITIDNIVGRADVGKGTFYLHFKDKETLVWEILLEGLDAVKQEADRWYRERPNMVFYGFLVSFEYAAKNQDLFRIMLGSHGQAMLTQRVKQYLAEEIEREVEAQTVFPEMDLPPRFIGQYLAGALTQTLIWWIETPNDYTPSQMAKMFYHMVFWQPYAEN